MARIARVVVPDFPHHVVQEYLTESDGNDNTNYELHLRTGRPLGAGDFVEQLERLIGTTLRPKKGGWQRGKKRK